MPLNAPSPAAAVPRRFLPPGLFVAAAALIGILLLPTPDGLPAAGHALLAILAFAVIVWLTEAVSYEVSAVLITVLMAFLVGAAPRLDDPSVAIGTAKALGMALGGFSSTVLALVAAALFIAAAMTSTGLDRRIALLTLSKLGTSARGVLVGAIVVTVLLSLVVPSATARSACVVPIMLGAIAAFGVDRRSNLAAGVMIVVAQATSIWNIGIQTAAAQNLLTVGFIERMFGTHVGWADWLIGGAPFALTMSAVLYLIVVKLLPPETDDLPGGRAAVERALRELGPTTPAQWRLTAVALALLVLWATGGRWHAFDTTSVTLAGLALLLLPRVGVLDWKTLQARTPWGTLVVFGTGISLGSALLTTQAGQWLGDAAVRGFGLDAFGPFGIFALLAAFLIVVHLGFASATALTAALLPILMSVLQALPGDFNRAGMTLLLGYVVSFGFVLPINAPQNMVCFGTGTFRARQFALVGLAVTLAGYLLLLLFGATYWRWLGWL